MIRIASLFPRRRTVLLSLILTQSSISRSSLFGPSFSARHFSTDPDGAPIAGPKDAADSFEDMLLSEELSRDPAAPQRKEGSVDPDDDEAYLMRAEGSESHADERTGGSSSQDHTSQLVESVRLLLPSNGEAVPLTAITPGLPLELICDEWGSVLKFLRTAAATDFNLSVDDEGRNMVSLKNPVAVQSLGMGKSVASPKRAPKRTRVSLQPVVNPPLLPSGHPLKVSLDEILTPTASSEGNSSGRRNYSRTVMEVGHKLDPKLLQEARSVYGSLLKMLRLHAEEYDVSADGLHVSLKGFLPPALLQPIDFVPSTKRKNKFDFGAEDEWAVELDLDDETDPAQSGFYEKPSIGAQVQAPLSVANPGSVAMPERQADSSITRMPAPQGDQRSPPTDLPLPPLPPGAGRKQTPLAMSTPIPAPSPLVATTPIGWKTPTEMLALFVECVPASFFVNMNALQAQGELKSMMLARGLTWAKLIRVYGYYFEVKRVGTGIDVKLRDAVRHPRKGEGDKIYASLLHAKLTTLPTAPQFPVLHRHQPAKEPLVEKVLKPPTFKWGAGSASGTHLHRTDSSPTTPSSTSAAVNALHQGLSDPFVRLILCSDLWKGFPNGLPLQSVPPPFPTDHPVLLHSSCGGSFEKFRQTLLQHPNLFFIRRPGIGEDSLLEEATAFIRPLNIAPGSTDMLGLEETTLPAILRPLQEFSKALGAAVKPKGVWLDLNKVLDRLDPSTRANLETFTSTHECSVADVLRRFGRAVWVSPEGTQLRLFNHSHPDIDDGEHFVVMELLKAVRAKATRDNPAVPLAVAVQALPESLQPLLPVGDSTAEFLRLHRRLFQVVRTGGSEPELGWSLLRAGTFFTATGGEKAGPTSSPGTGVKEKSSSKENEKQPASPTATAETTRVTAKKLANAAWNPAAAQASSWGKLGRATK